MATAASSGAQTPPYYHVGILVADLEDAVNSYATGLGVEFAPIRSVELQLRGAEEGRYVVRSTFTRQGPPYIELVEGQGEGLFSLAAGEGLHHIGRWVLPGRIDAVKRRLGEALTVTRLTPPTDYEVWFADRSAAHGVWIELVEETRRAEFEAWLDS